MKYYVIVKLNIIILCKVLCKFAKNYIVLSLFGVYMIKPDMIIRTNRRSMSLTVSKDGQVIIRAPKSLPLDRIFQFLNEKEGWVNKHLTRIKKEENNNIDIRNHQSYLILGKKYKPKAMAGIKKIEIYNNEIIYPSNWDDLTLYNKMKKYYLNLASEILPKRLEYFADLMQIDYSDVVIKGFKAKWGSCDNKGIITINYKTVMLPHRVIDYILIHELSHRIEFNHSPAFYKVIECIMDDWKKQRKQLHNYNYLLSV